MCSKSTCEEDSMVSSSLFEQRSILPILCLICKYNQYLQQNTFNISVKRGERFSWEERGNSGLHPANGSLDFCRELKSKSLALHVVIKNSVHELCFSRTKKFDFRYFLRFSIFLKTSFTGIEFISPRSNASMRLSASSAHSASILSLEGKSKLDKSCSISAARSVGGNFKASASISFPWSDISVSSFNLHGFSSAFSLTMNFIRLPFHLQICPELRCFFLPALSPTLTSRFPLLHHSTIPRSQSDRHLKGDGHLVFRALCPLRYARSFHVSSWKKLTQ